jgi:uncharacterized FAD-dependent dehydrogenase
LPEELELELGLEEADDPAALRALVARKLGRPESALPEVILRKRSIDARRGSVRFHLVVSFGSEPSLAERVRRPVSISGPPRVLIVGDGPCGLFCAYELACHGIGSIVLDRGKVVEEGTHDALMAAEGAYFNLYHAQARNMDVDMDDAR